MNCATNHTMDWRASLQRNNRQSYWVIASFVMIFIAIGFTADVLMQSYMLTPRYGYNNYLVLNVSHLPFVTIAKALCHGQLIPYITLFSSAFALLAVLITWQCHQSIFLLGTNAHQVEPSSNSPAEAQLYHIVEEMRLAAGLSYTPKIFIIDAAYMNAFASGWNQRSALIAVTTGLMQKLNRSELQAVIAHELSHILHMDIKLTLVASVLSNFILILIGWLYYSMFFARADQDPRGRRNQNLLFLIVIILRAVLPLITMVLIFYLSRRRELMADAGAVALMRDNEPLARALVKISNEHENQQGLYQNLYQSTPHESLRQQAYIFDPKQANINVSASAFELFSTHPTIAKRLQALGFDAKEKLN